MRTEKTTHVSSLIDLFNDRYIEELKQTLIKPTIQKGGEENEDQRENKSNAVPNAADR